MAIPPAPPPSYGAGISYENVPIIVLNSEKEISVKSKIKDMEQEKQDQIWNIIKMAELCYRQKQLTWMVV